MHVTLVMVETVDGKTTRWHEPEIHGWSSKEDQEHFRARIATHSLLVMGRKTYESVQNQIHLSPNLRRIVLTQRPEDYKERFVKGQLEFSDESPKALVKRMESEGHSAMLLVGGSEVNESFLSSHLISECYITIEPKFFGSGKSIFNATNIDISLQLLDLKRLNDQGTILLRYTIQYED